MEHKHVEWTAEQVKNFWDYESQFPEKYFTYTFGQRILEEVNEYIVNAESVLDYGTGIGLLIPHLLERNFEVTGLDFSHDSIEKVNKKFNGTPNFKGVLHIDEMLKLQKKFNVIFCIEMIEHINDHYLDITFDNFKHLLSDNGYIVITTPNDELLKDNMICCPNCNSIFHRWQHVKSWNTNSLEQTIAAYGFKKEKIYTTFFTPAVIEKKSASSFIADLIRKYVLFRKPIEKIIPGQKPPHLVAIIKK